MKLNLSAIMVAMVAAMLWGLPLLASAQLKTECDPTVRTCPANRALSRSASFDFTDGSGPDWKPNDVAVNYNSDGAAFTIEKQGDNPLLQSKFYIMFGRVDFVVKAAPGQGIVSTVLLASDCNDEIDFEWLGGDNAEVQTNYFRKGNEGNFAHGAFHADPGNHDMFKTYTIDWNKDRIMWQIDGNTIRTVTPADAGSQYPQTPSFIKLGIWAGGDPNEKPGTNEWAGGRTNYAAGPFTMQVKSVRATDYSSGTEYQYSDRSGNWQSIEAVGGQVNRQSSGTENFSANSNIEDTSSSATASPKATATKATSACPSGTAVSTDDDGDCSSPGSTSTSQESTPASSTASAASTTATTGAASKKSHPIGAQALVAASSLWGFLGALATIF